MYSVSPKKIQKIRSAAADYPCVRCDKDYTTRGAHYNGKRQLTLGKGRSIKGHDFGIAYFCDECDALFTEGSTSDMWATKWERSEEFLFYCMLTLIMLEADGILR